MDVDEAIRSRRTHKVYGSEPVDRVMVYRNGNGNGYSPSSS